MNGGPVRSISLAGREFAVSQDAEVILNTGGYKNEELAMNGDGTARAIGNVLPAKIEGAQIDIDPDAGDIDFIDALQSRADLFDGAVTLADGRVYGGLFVIVDADDINTKQGTMSITLHGEKLRPV